MRLGRLGARTVREAEHEACTSSLPIGRLDAHGGVSAGVHLDPASSVLDGLAHQVAEHPLEPGSVGRHIPFVVPDGDTGLSSERPDDGRDRITEAEGLEVDFLVPSVVAGSLEGRTGALVLNVTEGGPGTGRRDAGNLIVSLAGYELARVEQVLELEIADRPGPPG